MMDSETSQYPKWMIYAVFGVLLFLAAYLRWQGLWRDTLNWDELNVLAIAKLPLSELFRVLMLRDFHPPGFHLLLKDWILVLGDSDGSIHLLAWVLGIFALGACIGLVAKLWKDWRLTLLVLFGLTANPFLVKYATLTTPYSWHTAMVFLSWWLLWQLLEESRESRLQWIAYTLATVAAIHAHVLGLWFLPWQAIWLWRRNPSAAFRKDWLSCVGIAILTWVPFFITLIQPWHVSHHADLLGQHQRPWGMTYWAFPLNAIMLGVDRIETAGWTWVGLYVLGGLMWAWFVYSLMRLWRLESSRGEMMIGLTLGPLLLAAVLSIGFNLPTLVPRALLFCVPGIVIVMSWGFLNLLPSLRPFFRYAGLGLLAFIFWTQIDAIDRYAVPLDYGHQNAEATKVFYQPGDGIIVAPGWAHLSFMRYFDPNEFGLTARERNIDPLLQDVMHMIHRYDSRFFFVSGDDVWQSPRARGYLQYFEAHHKRILVVGWEPVLANLLNCKRQIWVLENNGLFSRFPCPGAS